MRPSPARACPRRIALATRQHEVDADPLDTADIAAVIEHVEVFRIPVAGAVSLGA
jgi:hypothetical protein